MLTLIEKSKTLLTSVALCAPALLAACAVAQGGDEGEATTAEQTEPLWKMSGITPWSQGVIPVCFKSSVPAALKTTVRRLVEESWESAASINFTGWQDCPANVPNGNVTVAVDGTLPADTAGLTSRPSNPTAGVTAIRYRSSSPSSRTVIHEFGHALGFLDENQSDTSCAQRTSGGTSVESEGDVALSIMAQSQCASSTTLSPWDIIGARVMYGLKHPATISGYRGLAINIQGGSTAQGTPVIGTSLEFNVWNDRFKRPADSPTSLLLRANPGVGGYRCLNIQGGSVSPTNPTPLISWACSDAHPNSRFQFQAVQLLAMGNRCVTAESSAAGSKLSINACSIGNTRQAWDLLDGNRNIRLSGTNLCVNVPNGSVARNTEVELATCSSSANQVFAFEISKIFFAGAACFNVKGGLTTNGSRIALWDQCVGDPILQNEIFTSRGPIRGLGQCIDMNTSGTPTDGVGLAMKPCSVASTQQWEYYW